MPSIDALAWIERLLGLLLVSAGLRLAHIAFSGPDPAGPVTLAAGSLFVGSVLIFDTVIAPG